MEKQALAIFDFDGTMITGDSIVSFLRFAVKEGRLSPFSIPEQLISALMGILGLKSAEAAKSYALRFLKHMDAEEVYAFCQDFCEHILRPRLYPLALQRMEEHRRQGMKLLLVSASPDIYLKHMAPLLSVDAILATPSNARGEVARNTKGEEKIRRLKAWLDEQGIQMDSAASWAYGDSASDLPLLKLCGHPVMVNPKRKMIKQGGSIPIEIWRP